MAQCRAAFVSDCHESGVSLSLLVSVTVGGSPNRAGLRRVFFERLLLFFLAALACPLRWQDRYAAVLSTVQGSGWVCSIRGRMAKEVSRHATHLGSAPDTDTTRIVRIASDPRDQEHTPRKAEAETFWIATSHMSVPTA